MAYVASRRACYFRLGEQLLALGSEHLRQIVAVGSVTGVPRGRRDQTPGLFKPDGRHPRPRGLQPTGTGTEAVSKGLLSGATYPHTPGVYAVGTHSELGG